MMIKNPGFKGFDLFNLFKKIYAEKNWRYANQQERNWRKANEEEENRINFLKFDTSRVNSVQS